MEQDKVCIGDYEYNVSQKLGQGAYGTVYRGRRLSECSDGSDEHVALKRVPSGRLSVAEVNTPVKAQSPYIVNFLDVVEVKSEDMTYVVMELCDIDLGDFLTKYGKLTSENLETLAKCLAKGYMSLYDNSIVHRDVKPQNILLKLKPLKTFVIGNDDEGKNRKQEQPKIEIAKFADFGSCSETSKNNSKELGNLIGTVLYMAPEVGAGCVESNKYANEIDMWSMGVVLFECITGDVPFTEQKLCKLYLRAMQDNYFGYRAPVPDNASEKLRYVIGQLLSFDPSTRLNPQEFYDIVCGDKFDSILKSLQNNTANDYDDVRKSSNVRKPSTAIKPKTKSYSLKRIVTALCPCT